MPSRTSLGIDLGTTNTKAAVVELDTARVRAAASTPTPAAADLGPTLRELLPRVLDREDPAPVAVGLASMAETGVPLDPDGRAIGEWLRWDGHRAGAEADALAGRLGWAELIAATGVRPSGKVPLAVWSWLRENRPDAFAAMARWAGVADLAGWLLTGRLATDHTLAGRTMACRLPATDGIRPDGFDAALLAEVGMRPDQLPDVVVDGAIGRVTDPGFGLPLGTPVVIAGHDHAVGAYAAGVREPGRIADSLGTAEAILTITAAAPDPVAVARTGMSLVVTVGGAWAILAGSSSAGAVVQWWLKRESGGLAADELFARAARVAGPTDVVVLPYLSGRQTPEPDPHARLRVLGRTDQPPPYLARAVLEGLALHARWMAQVQVALAGVQPDTVTVLGGPATTNTAWLQIKAQVMPWPVQVVDAAEPVAAGAALIAAERAGFVDPAPVLRGRLVPGGDPNYDRPFDRFVSAATTREVREP